MNRQVCFASVIAISLSAACSGSTEAGDSGGPGPSSPTEDGSSGSQNGFGDASTDTGGPGTNPNETCARLEARPQPKASAVWFVFDARRLSGQVASNPDPQTNREMLGELLFAAGGIVPRLETFVQFGLAHYYVPTVDVLLAGGRCPEGITIEPTLNNTQTLVQAFADIPLSAGASWAALEDISTAIAAQRKPTKNTVVLVHSEYDAVCDFSNGRDKLRAAAQKLADQGATVSAVAILYAMGQTPEYIRLNMEAQMLGQELAALGGGQAFASHEAEAIRQAIARSVEDAVSCEVALQGKVEAGKECRGQVLLGGEAVPCNDANGFRLIDDSTLELTGTACKRLREKVGATLSANFPCDAFVLY